MTNSLCLFNIADEQIPSAGGFLLVLGLILTVCVLLILVLVIVSLIRSRREYSRLLFQKTYFNDLTGSPNLSKFRKDAERLLTENEDEPYAVMRISIEGLDFLNEIFSLATGDKVIIAAADALKETCDEKTSCYAHIYSDRFIALFPCGSFDELDIWKAYFERRFNEKVSGLVNIKVQLSAGLYLIEPGETDLNSILEKVSFAHHAARQSERLEEKTQRYDGKLKEQMKLERKVEAQMEQALFAREFTMFLQPKYRLENNSLHGAEALSRWWVDGKAVMYPSEFIPIFEKNGFVVKLDMFMFEEACRFLSRLIDEDKPLITISTNFSRLHLLKGGFVSKLAMIADKYDVPHEYLEVEITESSMVGNENVLKAVLADLHRNGFTLSMDDFGTGYSSLGLLKEIPIDVMKIDRSFFESSREVERERIVIESVIDMAKKLGIHTVAEGVETQEHIDFLRQLGCEIVQGYYFSKPMPSNEFYRLYLE